MKLKNPAPRYVKICKTDETSIDNFVEEIRNCELFSKLDRNMFLDPNNNLNILEKTIEECKNKHLPTRTVKFNKYKHKKSDWITSAIIKSIQFRDKLYLKLKTTNVDSPMHNTLKINLKTYNSILNRTITNAKKILLSKSIFKIQV